jgi:hypothetical protein
MLATFMAAALLPIAAEPIRLHSENPHYFLFRGKPVFLITSGEHYGAVINADFDFKPYLAELESSCFNLTRAFSGVYFEVPGSFKIEHNTLAPKPDRVLTPWARREDKYDLDRWDDAYFQRLETFLAEAGRRGIVVELVLFCPFYEDSMWDVSPMNARNNANAVETCPRTEVYTLRHPKLLERQDALVRKLVNELKEFDNLYYEICNEPYFGGVTLEWQAHIAATIVDAERNFPTRHLIAQNIANGKAKIERPDPAVSLFNFHYATPPDTVGLNYGLNKALADDETGFRGTGDRAYRTEAWDFLLAGGSVFDHLDYSFTLDHPDGTAKVTDPTPGGGGPTLRAQFKILRDFLAAFDFVRMAPNAKTIAQTEPKETLARMRCLCEPGRAYAVYASTSEITRLTLELPAATYRAEWLDPLTGKVVRLPDIDHKGGRISLDAPKFAEDIALKITRR